MELSILVLDHSYSIIRVSLACVVLTNLCEHISSNVCGYFKAM
jgi:hypothetical protein